VNRYGTLLFLGLFGVGCASIRMTSVTDPAGKGKHYQSFIVLAKLADQDMRAHVERRVVERLEEAGVEGIASLDLLPPTKEYTESEITTQLWARGIEGFLVLSVHESGASRIPDASTLPESGARPTASLRIELFDVLQQRRAWISTAQAKGGEYATFTTVAPYCDKIVEQMRADNLLSRNRP
jgi:hypothetical protein